MARKLGQERGAEPGDVGGGSRVGRDEKRRPVLSSRVAADACPKAQGRQARVLRSRSGAKARVSCSRFGKCRPGPLADRGILSLKRLSGTSAVEVDAVMMTTTLRAMGLYPEFGIVDEETRKVLALTASPISSSSARGVLAEAGGGEVPWGVCLRGRASESDDDLAASAAVPEVADRLWNLVERECPVDDGSDRADFK